MVMAVLRSISLTYIVVLLRCGETSQGYDPTGRIYPWPLPPDKKPLFFSLIVSFGETFNSSGVVPGVNVALDIINSNDSNLLSGYSLHYILSDSQCSRTRALDVFFQQILSESQYQKLAVIGAGCSPATEPTAEVSHQFNITQLSCASNSPVLSDRRRFKKYFQLLPSIVDIIHGYVGVFKYYGWRHVVMIIQEENLFTEMTRNLKELLMKEGIMSTEYTFSTDIGLSDLKTEPFMNLTERIYLIATFEDYARMLLCKAFHRTVRYPTHVLMTFQWYDEKWWLKERGAFDDNLTCSGKERESVLLHTLAFNYILTDLLKAQNVTTDIGINGNKYLQRETAHTGTAPHYFNQVPCAQYCFDATLTLAYALNRTLTDIQNSETNTKLASIYGLANGTFGLEHFNYGNDALTNITFLHLQDTSFNGITGEVLFNERGIREADYLSVHQFRDVDEDGVNWVRVGTIVRQDGSDDYIFDANFTLSAVWPRGIPYDGTITKEISRESTALVVVIYILAAAGVVFAIVCLAFNYIFRNKKLIRLSSPKLNNIIIFGVIILYLAMVIFAIPTQSKSAIHGLCIARLWFLSLGVSLAFGTIIMKMFRVYTIFCNPSPKRKKFIKDWMLALVVLIMVIVDLVVLIIFTTVVGVGNLTLVEVIPHKENPQSEQGVARRITEYCIHICQSTPERIAVGVLSTYKIILQLMALLLAIHTQRVKVKGLNDSKYIIAAVYASSLGLLLAIITHFFVIEYLQVHAVLFAISLGFSSTAILGFIFIPKMIGLYKDPEGEKVFAKSNSGDAIDLSLGTRLSAQQQKHPQPSNEDALRRRIKELESILSTYSGSKSISDSGIRLEVSSEHNSNKVDLEIHKQEMPQSDEDMTNSLT